jgi:predicted RNase H-like HicB family nuclease
MSKADYSIVIDRLPDDEGGGYVARVPDLPGCMSDGATDIEALENVHDAIDAWLEQAKQMGRAIPTPTRQRLYA